MRLAAALTAAFVAAVDASQSQPEPALRQVLVRLDAYLARYESLLAAVVADEHYEQTLNLARSDASLTRVLRSEYALARAPGGQAWSGYRDVWEVDGRPVRDRDARRLALLDPATPDGGREAMRITRENARFNLGEELVSRTINVPTVALDLIHPRHRARMSFAHRGRETIDGRMAWTLAFEERERGTILRSPSGADRRSRGGVWVDPVTGEVLRTDLSWDGEPHGVISVRYRSDANIGVLVPGTMVEEYRGAKGTITARATYTNYRRFRTEARVVAPAAR